MPGARRMLMLTAAAALPAEAAQAPFRIGTAPCRPRRLRRRRADGFADAGAAAVAIDCRWC
jgi:hypothetical protein